MYEDDYCGKFPCMNLMSMATSESNVFVPYLGASRCRLTIFLCESQLARFWVNFLMGGDLGILIHCTDTKLSV